MGLRARGRVLRKSALASGQHNNGVVVRSAVISPRRGFTAYPWAGQIAATPRMWRTLMLIALFVPMVVMESLSRSASATSQCWVYSCTAAR